MGTVSDVTVRPANADDLDEVANVWHESAMFMDGAEPHVPSSAELRARIETELGEGWSLFVAVDQSEVVGMLALKLAEGVLDQLFVRPEGQRKGVGRRLLSEAKRQMPAGFILRMATANARAGRFYRANGLSLLRSDVHPRTSRPVQFYRWNVC